MSLNNLVNDKKSTTAIEGIIGFVAVAMLSAAVYGGYLGISALRKYIDRPVVERADVMGKPKAELFIDKDGKRFYAEIDGKPISEYLK